MGDRERCWLSPSLSLSFCLPEDVFSLSPPLFCSFRFLLFPPLLGVLEFRHANRTLIYKQDGMFFIDYYFLLLKRRRPKKIMAFGIQDVQRAIAFFLLMLYSVLGDAFFFCFWFFFLLLLEYDGKCLGSIY